MSSIKTEFAVDLTIPREDQGNGLRLLVDTFRKTADSLQPLIAVGYTVERVSAVRGGLRIILRGSGLLTNDHIFPSQHENLTIDDLNLPTLTRNALVVHGNIRTVRELVQKAEREVMKIRNMGSSGLAHIKGELTMLGLRLGMKLEEPPR